MFSKPLVLGLGKSGFGALELFAKKGIAAIGTDKDSSLFQKKEALLLKKRGIGFFPEKEANVKECDALILSPGIAEDHFLVKKAKEKKIPIIGEVELALRFCNSRILAITGTNGKTTTVLLIEFILNRAGIKAKSLGNVGTSLASAVLDLQEEEIVVLELSSYQLETLQSKTLDLGVILNITPDHLDRYSDFQSYAKAKLNIYRCLKAGAPLFIPKELEKNFEGKENICLLEDIVLQNGLAQESKEYAKSYNEAWENIAAAFAACSFLKVSKEQFFLFLKEFKKPHHRIEFVSEIGGVLFYDDSKATNTFSVVHAIRALRGPIVLIAGGVDKKLSFRDWNEEFKGRVKHILAIGECALRIKDEVDSCPVEVCKTLAEAVQKAYSKAEANETVLLSPGCSSFDMFKSYEHRGEQFQECVKTLESRR